MRKFTIITDANEAMGIGHSMRCLAIAEVFLAQGWRVALETWDMLEPVRREYAARGIAIQDRDEANEASAIVARAQAAATQLMLIDGYHLGADFRRRLADGPARIMAMDDHGDAKNFIADIVINPWHYSDSLQLPDRPSVTLLSGSKFFPFRESFQRAANSPIPALASRRHLLLTLGGSDPIRLTEKFVAKAKSELPEDVTLDIVVGPANRRAGPIRQLIGDSGLKANLHISPANLPELMCRAGLAISAGGGTSAELACLGTPLLMTLIAENQEINGANAWCPVVDGRQPSAAEDLLQLSVELWRDEAARRAIARAGQSHFHGNGAQRIFDAVIGRSGIGRSGVGGSS